MNHLTITGNLGRDPETKTTPSGRKVTVVSIGVSQGKDKESLWLQLEAWHNDSGYSAGAALAALGKGDRVVAAGRLGCDFWDDKETGAKRERFKLTVSDVAPVRFVELDNAPGVPANVGAKRTGRTARPTPQHDEGNVPF